MVRHYREAQGKTARFSADSKRVVLATGPLVQIIDSTTGRKIMDLTDANEGAWVEEWIVEDRKRFPVYEGAAFSSDSRFVIAFKRADGEVRIWKADTGKLIASLQHGRTVGGAVFSPDGRKIVSFGGAQEGGKHTIRIWEVREAHK